MRNPITRYAILLGALFAATGNAAQCAPSVAEQAVQAVMQAQAPGSAQAPRPDMPVGYDWDKALKQDRPVAASPAQETATASPAAPLAPPAPTQESAAQHFYRIVEDSKLYLAAKPRDWLGEILERIERAPWSDPAP